MMGLARRAARRIVGNAGSPIVPLTASQVASAELRVAIAGDVGHPSAELEMSVAAMVNEHARRPFDALVLLGDNIYPDGDPARVGEAVFEPLAPILARGVVLVAVLGNHDVDRGQPDEVARCLGMPARWYECRFGPVQLIALDSTRAGDRAQRDWLDQTLAGSDAALRLVALHHPPYSAGWHGSSRDVRRAFGPAFARHGVDVVLAGHEHDYQRSRPIKGTVYVVSGATTHLRATGKRRFTAAAHARHHFLDLWVVDEHAVIQPIGHDGQPFDQVIVPFRGARGARDGAVPAGSTADDAGAARRSS